MNARSTVPTAPLRLHLASTVVLGGLWFSAADRAANGRHMGVLSWEGGTRLRTGFVRAYHINAGRLFDTFFAVGRNGSGSHIAFPLYEADLRTGEGLNLLDDFSTRADYRTKEFMRHGHNEKAWCERRKIITYLRDHLEHFVER